MEKPHPELNGPAAAKLRFHLSLTTRRGPSSRQHTEITDTRPTEKYRLASLRKRAVCKRNPSGNMEDAQASGGSCVCSSSTKSKRPSLPVPWPWSKIRRSGVRFLHAVTIFAGTGYVGWNNGSLIARAKGRAFTEPWH